MALNLNYPEILEQIGEYSGEGRTEPQAFLAWFLDHYYHLDHDAASDAVCDGVDDKGIDGIYVDNNLETVDVLQAKLVKNEDRTLGDTELKEFVGTLAQFDQPETIEAIAESTGNFELKRLIEAEDIAQKIVEGYEVQGVFVCNAPKDGNAESYLEGRQGLVLYDRTELELKYVPLGPTKPSGKPVAFEASKAQRAVYEINGTRVVIAPLQSKQLLSLEGIAGGSLYAWNVRQSLGKTKVNKAIRGSIQDEEEHKNFMLFHNGLTILCQEIDLDVDQITIKGYTVVNGCQSLTTLYDNRDQITDDLKILGRLIELDPDSPLARKITQNTNNQNPISARDLQSNSVHQRRIQKEFESNYPGEYFYRIKRGEETSGAAEVVDNQAAARILLAFDLDRPWSCHQTYKLFDDLYTEIFARPEVTAQRILALWAVYEAVEEQVGKISNELMAGYNLTKFFLLHLLKQALLLDELGRDFVRKPGIFLDEENGYERLKYVTGTILSQLIIDLNAALDQRAKNDDPIDYKRELKSVSAVNELTRNIVPHYQMAVDRNRGTSFSEEWMESQAKLD